MDDKVLHVQSAFSYAFKFFTVVALGLTTTFSATTYRGMKENKKEIAQLRIEMDIRNAVAAKYLPIIDTIHGRQNEQSKRIDAQADLISRIMDRNKEIRKELKNKKEK